MHREYHEMETCLIMTFPVVTHKILCKRATTQSLWGNDTWSLRKRNVAQIWSANTSELFYDVIHIADGENMLLGIVYEETWSVTNRISGSSVRWMRNFIFNIKKTWNWSNRVFFLVLLFLIIAICPISRKCMRPIFDEPAMFDNFSHKKQIF